MLDRKMLQYICVKCIKELEVLEMMDRVEKNLIVIGELGNAAGGWRLAAGRARIASSVRDRATGGEGKHDGVDQLGDVQSQH